MARARARTSPARNLSARSLPTKLRLCEPAGAEVVAEHDHYPVRLLAARRLWARGRRRDDLAAEVVGQPRRGLGELTPGGIEDQRPRRVAVQDWVRELQTKRVEHCGHQIGQVAVRARPVRKLHWRPLRQQRLAE